MVEAKIQKWGNSLGVRIPATAAKTLRLQHGSIVDVFEEADRLVIRPRRTPDLDTLLDEITDTNLHVEVDFGTSQGNEAW